MLSSSLSARVHDDGVTFRFEVSNEGDDPVELRFRSGQTAEVTVRSEEREVWSSAEGQMFTQAIREVTLDPTESVTSTVTWSDPPPGSFEATAELAAEPSVTARTAVRVPE